jgi:hypothetical protein
MIDMIEMYWHDVLYRVKNANLSRQDRGGGGGGGLVKNKADGAIRQYLTCFAEDAHLRR